MKHSSDILQLILTRKREEIIERRQQLPLAALQERLTEVKQPRGFAAALAARVANNEPGIIAEIKRASPSKGLLRADFNPIALAQSYAAGGATCLSVLTDCDFFQGADIHLQQASAACALPVLRKDFIVDPYQIYEAYVLGADAILLIVAALDDAQLLMLHDLARNLGLDVLIETHHAEELTRALRLDTPLIGVNNRDLRSFNVCLETTLELIAQIPSGRILVTESGIQTPEDVRRLRAQGVPAFLIGESGMRAADPGACLAELFAL